MVKDLEIKCHDVCNLLSNYSKEKCVCTGGRERRRERDRERDGPRTEKQSKYYKMTITESKQKI